MLFSLFSLLTAASFHVTPATTTLMITNECDSDVYLTLVCGQATGSRIIPVSATARIPYPASPGGETACSAKLNLDDNMLDVFQFEYSFDDEYRLWWDLSSLDGDPFLQYGRVVRTSGGDAGTRHCPSRFVCKRGSEKCAYYEYKEEGPNWWCNRKTNVTLTLCETDGLEPDAG